MFSLRTMLLAVMVAAICAAGFVYRTPMWASIVVTMALGFLVFGLAAIYFLPEKRAFFVPACLAGIVYGAAAFCQPLGLQAGLTTNRLLFEAWYSEEMHVEFTGLGLSIDDKDVAYTMLSNDSMMLPMIFEGAEFTNSFRFVQQVGHATIAIVLAVGAGLIGSYVERKRRDAGKL